MKLGFAQTYASVISLMTHALDALLIWCARLIAHGLRFGSYVLPQHTANGALVVILQIISPLLLVIALTILILVGLGL